jgi:hypothetical protein
MVDRHYSLNLKPWSATNRHKKFYIVGQHTVHIYKMQPCRITGHSRKHSYHPHGGNWKLTPLPPLDVLNYTFTIMLVMLL